jgi:hypothetical protein
MPCPVHPYRRTQPASGARVCHSLIGTPSGEVARTVHAVHVLVRVAPAARLLNLVVVGRRTHRHASSRQPRTAESAPATHTTCRRSTGRGARANRRSRRTCCSACRPVCCPARVASSATCAAVRRGPGGTEETHTRRGGDDSHGWTHGEGSGAQQLTHAANLTFLVSGVCVAGCNDCWRVPRLPDAVTCCAEISFPI